MGDKSEIDVNVLSGELSPFVSDCFAFCCCSSCCCFEVSSRVHLTSNVK